MNEVDEQDSVIDRVLTGIGDVQPPAGLERRILAGLAARQTVRSQRGEAGLRQWLASPLLLCGLAAVMILAGFVAMKWPPPHHQLRVADATPKLTPGEANGPHALTVHARSIRQLRPTAPEPVSAKGGLRDRDTWVLNGYPPPPMPLTDQERLLLELAHRRAPRQLAVLNSTVLSAHEHEERAEFDEFFAARPLPPLPAQPEAQPGPIPSSQGAQQ